MCNDRKIVDSPMCQPIEVSVTLSVRGVSVRFGGLSALDDVSFDVEPGSVVGVIGPNGAGKTTLFNVISGFVRPNAGSIDWEGRPLPPAPDRLVGLGIARTLQAVGLFPRLTALENVMTGAAHTRRTGFASALFGLPRSDREERQLRADALDWLGRLDVADDADRLPPTLPFPVQKRIALARALVSRPRLLLLDEPAGGLGAEDIATLRELIRSLPHASDSPCSVLLVEHHMDLVMAVCDRVIVLDFGRSVCAGTPEQVKADPAVAAAYLGVEVSSDDFALTSADVEETR
jgi:branched-chain amino acid transport system ATP-binding protein